MTPSTIHRTVDYGEWIEALPKTIRVGPYDIRITKNAPSDVWGYFSADKLEVAINNYAPSLAKALDTVLHELGHVVWWAYNMEGEEGEEKTVATFATGWNLIFIDNPKLLDWINKVTVEIHRSRAE